jgi:hypothetical protein
MALFLRTTAALALATLALIALGGSTATATQAPLAHRLLPWHRAVLDDQGKLLAWYRPRDGLGYDHVLRLGWRFIERRVPPAVYLHYPVFDERTLKGIYWQHNPAFLYASFVDSLVSWYPYSADRRAVTTVKAMLDYHLAHGTTPKGWAWSRVPFATSCGGDRTYGRCLAGMPRGFYGGGEPDKIGLLGLGYLRFYELTGGRRYLRAAVEGGNALARHVRAGDAKHTPWPFRVDLRTGAVLEGAQFGGLVVGPVSLLDELIRIGAGNTPAYRRARDLAWSWMLDNQLNPDSAAWNRWSGFYEDVALNPLSRNQAVPTITAMYLVRRGADVDPSWVDHAASLVEWVRTSFGRGPFFGAWAIDEQLVPGRGGCCSPAGLGSTTSRWAVVNAMLYASTGDPGARERAVRSLNYATYFVSSDGHTSCCGRRSGNEHWFSDGYGDFLRHFNWAMAAMPEVAPKRQDHLLGSTSVVQAVTYRPLRIEYRTFDAGAVDVLRLSFRPRRVLAGSTPLAAARDLRATGYVLEALDGGDFVLRIRHDDARRIVVTG